MHIQCQTVQDGDGRRRHYDCSERREVLTHPQFTVREDKDSSATPL